MDGEQGRRTSRISESAPSGTGAAFRRGWLVRRSSGSSFVWFVVRLVRRSSDSSPGASKIFLGAIAPKKILNLFSGSVDAEFGAETENKRGRRTSVVF